MKKLRTCRRFAISGATISYKFEKILTKKEYSEESFPVLNLSCGGLLFLTQSRLKKNIKVSMKIMIPDDKDPLIMKGKVIWVSLNPGMSYKYRIGVMFNPYSKSKRQNDPGCLDRLKELELRFLDKKEDPFEIPLN